MDVKEAAARLSARVGVTISAKDIAKLFTDGHLRDDLCPGRGVRREIPDDYLPVLLMVARRRLPQFQAAAGDANAVDSLAGRRGVGVKRGKNMYSSELKYYRK